jgi:hypothetical protein
MSSNVANPPKRIFRVKRQRKNKENSIEIEGSVHGLEL